MAGFEDFVDGHPFILMEAAVVERLRRSGAERLHEKLVNAPLVYDGPGKAALRDIYGQYLDIAATADLPFIMCAPTWRANAERVRLSRAPASINKDAVEFMMGLRASWGTFSGKVKIGGLMGCKNDCYKPRESLSVADAEDFHSSQAEELARAGADFLIAVTLPALLEAEGLARAMCATGKPYIISFVISRQGALLDGTSLMDAVMKIDSEVATPPLGYMMSCAHPSFLRADRQPAALFERLIGCQANASSFDHDRLDGSGDLCADPVHLWGEEMLALHRQYGLKILGGCCGTADEHLRYLTAAVSGRNS